MTRQAEILFDIMRRERALEATPARLERRRALRLLEEVARCCREASPIRRLLDALQGPALGCCVTG